MKKLLFAILSFSLLLTGCASKEETQSENKEEVVEFYKDTSRYEVTHTGTIEIKNYGTLEFELYGKEAPITVQRFVDIAEIGDYDHSEFHRIVKGFMMQGGIPKNDTEYPTIQGEFYANGIKNSIAHTAGVMSFCRSQSYDSGSEQFFICYKDLDNNGINGYYAAFGKITKGLDIVQEICETIGKEDQSGQVDEKDRPQIVKVTVEEK